MGLSERKIIEEIYRGVLKDDSVLVSAGMDDAAVIHIKNKSLVITSDIMFESSHFPKEMKPEEIGRKTVVANLSDLASMGAKPLYIILSLGIPKKYAKINQLIKGIKETCKEYRAIIAGGDTKCSEELTISICAIGEMSGNLLTRNNARAGDVVAVTGDIGSAYCGLHSIIRSRPASPLLFHAFTQPKAKIMEGMMMAGDCNRAAAMDITDGLLHTASEIAKLSKVRIEIEKKLIPISPLARQYARKNKIPFDKLINSGEDYELFVCLSERDFKRVGKRVGLIRIGKATKGIGVFLDGKKIKIRGYDAFQNRL